MLQLQQQPVYRTADWNGESTKGTFYQEVKKTDTCLVNKALKKRRTGRETQLYVKRLGSPISKVGLIRNHIALPN